MDPLCEALAILETGRGLSVEQTHDAVETIMAGSATDAVIAAFLTALHHKGETAEELAGAVRAVRARMTPLAGDFPPVLDTCGTGGDGANTVNVSTATALVSAASGAPVAKHGNRSASGNSGSSEVLTALGISIEADPDTLTRCLIDLRITFLFAPRFHPALRFAARARRQLPFRTLFNLVGPLANPARPAYQLVGVPGERLAALMAKTLADLGTTRAAVVTGSDGLDEVTLAGPTRVLWVEHGEIQARTWTPDDFGLPLVEAAELRVSGPAESADRLRKVFAGKADPARAVVLANTAAALLVAGRVSTLRDGVACAADAIDSGASAALLDRWRDLSPASG
ncbi:MAG: anthranilate phosphoribosyltransferase [Isosphaeraceae bacterium]